MKATAVPTSGNARPNAFPKASPAIDISSASVTPASIAFLSIALISATDTAAMGRTLAKRNGRIQRRMRS
jgi:hypothetical protein